MSMELASPVEMEKWRKEADERMRLRLAKNHAIARRFWNKELPWLWLIAHLPHDGQEVMKQRLSKPEKLLEKLGGAQVFVRFVNDGDEWVKEMNDDFGSRLIDYLARFYTQTTPEKWDITHLVVVVITNRWGGETPKIRVLVPPKSPLGFRSLLDAEIIRQSGYEGVLGPEPEEE